ncbi:transcriptional regulator [Ewingella americana]|uniref:transcriptional regulator n=1 Tax=Ewingella americana TaxID=41202 RepID=UPI00163B3A5C|nr:transcriptional regulator [Ewingella americana]QMV52772.1 transcriptional regulator [Ewingella americana]
MRVLFIAIFVLGLALLGMTVYTHGLQRDKLELTQSRDALAQQLGHRDQLIAELNQQIQTREQAEVALREALTQANGLVWQREQLFQRSRNDDPLVKTWADSALPAAVSQLHQRPAFSSATDYLHWLSASQRLPDTRQSSTK